MFDTTIVAIATAPGTGAIATIRVSGKDAINITASIFRSALNKDLRELSNSKLYFGEIVHVDEVIDEVLLVRFEAPYSYTGENSVEISCHGSVFIQQEILRLLIDRGCISAAPGEFTQRAFINGKMDLSQAEAVADLIASSSEGAHRLAMKQMKGAFSKELDTLRTRLLNFASLIELELDFSEEDVLFADRSQLRSITLEIAEHIGKLAASFKAGNAIKTGVPVAIVGATNVGKSTLLNALLKEDRAIVSNIHGTTRDVIEDTIVIDGILFRFIDTAGIRNTSDVVESMGIERSFQKISQASIVLWITDASIETDFEEIAAKILPETKDKILILILNKIDQLNSDELLKKQNIVKQLFPDIRIHLLSAINGEGLPCLEQLLVEAAQLPDLNSSDVIVTNIRHYEILQKAFASINRVTSGLDGGITNDFIAQDLRECILCLGEITGTITSNDILENVFGKFCIGK